MYQLDEEPIETMHVYVYKEEPKPAWWNRDRLVNLLIGFMALAGIISLCLIPNEPAYAIQTVSVPAHFLPPQTFTVNSLVTPTGSKTYPATYAHGILTITNGSVVSQELPAGIIFNSNQGTDVATDSSVFVPAGNAEGFGVSTVPAHLLASGINMSTLAVDQVVGTSLYVRNLSPFTGGKPAYTVKVVTGQDKQTALDNARSTLVSQRNRYPGLLAYPCKENTTQKELALMVSWGCQFVNFTPPPEAKVLSARVAGSTVVLQIRTTILAYPTGLPGK